MKIELNEKDLCGLPSHVFNNFIEEVKYKISYLLHDHTDEEEKYCHHNKSIYAIYNYFETRKEY